MRFRTAQAALAAALLSVATFAFTPRATAQSWTQLACASPPPPRTLSYVAFDPASDRMIIFGGDAYGTSINSDLNDLWWLVHPFGPTLTCLQATATGSPPAPRESGQSAAYDAAHDRMIIFGGGLGSTSPCVNDTWVLEHASGATGTPNWTQLHPAGGAPSPRNFAAVVYDPGSNELILYGGADCFSTFYNDVWILSNANGLTGTPTWTQVSPAGGAPGRRGSHTGVYDAGSNRLIIFGGYNASVSSMNDTWVLSNANALTGTPTWSELLPMGTLPPPRVGHVAVYDQANKRMTIYGGLSNENHPPYTTLSDTWVLSNAEGRTGAPVWTEIGPLPDAPAREGAAGAYNPVTNQLTIFGGYDRMTDTFGTEAFVLSDANGLPPGQCVPPPSGLVGWWPGDGNANDIVGGNNGTLVGGVTFAPSEVGQAFSFDGVSGYATVPDAANLRLSAVTLDAWININNLGAEQGVITKAEASGNWVSYMLRIEAGSLPVGVPNGAVSFYLEDQPQSRGGHWTTTSTLSPGIWYHVAATWQNTSGDSTDAEIYINGTEQSTTFVGTGYDSTFAPEYTSEPLYLGRQEVAGRGYFQGLVDEIEIFNRVLSTSEIQAIYNAGSAGKCKAGLPTATATPTATPMPTLTPPSPGSTPVVIQIGTAVGAPGGQVRFPVTLKTNGAAVAGVQNRITFDSHAPIAAAGDGSPDCAVNPGINKGDTTFAFEPGGCAPESTCTAVEAFVVALGSTGPVPNGSQLYTCRVSIAADAPLGQRYPLACSAPRASDPAGQPVPTTCTDGAIAVATTCGGDCDGDGQVTVDEVITMVNIALDNANISACTAGDTDGDNRITIGELVAAVSNAVRGCRN